MTPVASPDRDLDDDTVREADTPSDAPVALPRPVQIGTATALQLIQRASTS